MIGEVQRPSMRRKSSAQNLLSSFKSTPISAAQTATVSSATGLQYAAPISTATTPMTREWDVQSLQSESMNGTPTLAQGTSVEMLRELVKKRIITLTYLRNVHDGRSHWFHTIMVTRAELERVFSNAAMKNRTYRFAVLGMSLAHSFDIKDPQDLLKGLSNALNEYDLSKEDGDRSRMRLFRPRLGKRQPGSDYATPYTDASESSFLVVPHLPFPLDYHQTLLSLLDVLSEVYHKISTILGPSPFPSGAPHMAGPLGPLAPHPGVSYLFTTPEPSSASLWGIAGGSILYGGALGSPPPSWNAGLADTVRQIDNKLKKLVATLLKELDEFARAGIRDELASLDPLLRNVAAPDEGPRDFEAGEMI